MTKIKKTLVDNLQKFWDEEEAYRQVFKNKLDHLSWADVPLEIIMQVRELVEPYVKRKDK